MTRKPDVPSYKKHKATKQGYVILDGKRRYLGRFNTPESKLRYDRLIAEWLTRGRQTHVEKHDLTVAELLNRFRSRLEGDGADKRELDHYKVAAKTVRELYGDSPAADFGPLKLKAVRERLIAEGRLMLDGTKRPRTRQYVNRLIERIKAIFKWSVAEELVGVATYEALRAVDGLRHGKTTAPEAKPVRPVPQEFIDAVKPYVSKQVAAMIDLQLLTAARPGELCAMRPIDLATGGKVWIYTPATHKTAWRGRERAIYLGPKSQAVVQPFLTGRPTESYMFSAAEAVADQREQRHEERETPKEQGNNVGTNRKRRPRKEPGECYTPRSYYGAILYACRRAGIDPWSPYQLRHNAATNLRKQFGLDVAQVMLGHSRADVTQLYAEKNTELALSVAEKVG